MKTWIKTSLMAALAATTLASGAAMARCGGHGWGGQGWQNATPEQIRERMNQQMELHLARLELALALTPEQKPAWADFKKAAEARAETMQKEMETWRTAGQPKTAIERLERAEEFSKKHTSMLADIRKSVEAFYSKLNATQKTVFDGEAANFGGCGMGMGMGMGHGPGCMMGDPETRKGPGTGKGGGRGRR